MTREIVRDRIDEYGRTQEIECAGNRCIARHTIRERFINGRSNIHVRSVLMLMGRKVIKTNSFYR